MTRIFLTILCLFGLCTAYADTTPNFSREQLSLSDGSVLPYRQMQTEGETPMLVIYLHGGSSCGTDNEAQMSEAGIDSIAHYLLSKNTPVVFIVPQCNNKTTGWSGMAAQVKQLLDYVAQQTAADTTRIYILGSSMGGTGTWRMLSLYSNYFAAAMPCAGNPKDAKAEDIATTPVYTVMGLADKVMDSDVRAAVATMVSQLQTLGDDAVYDVLRGWTHEMTCIQSYSTHRLDWLFAHQRGQKTNLTTPPSEPVDDSWYDLSGRRYDSPTTQSIYVHHGKKIIIIHI